MSQRLRVLYLHGFASGPQSRKAQFFAQQFAASGIPVMVPDLAAGAFEHLTISDQLEVVRQTAEEAPAVLIGSSLGGYLASLFAASHPTVRRLVLLAPAFHFVDLWRKRLGPQAWTEWEGGKPLLVHHYAHGRDMPLSFDLMRDAIRYPPAPAFSQPALIFHGKQDDVVPVESSLDFANLHPNARVMTLESGHELTDVLQTVWNLSQDFLIPAGADF